MTAASSSSSKPAVYPQPASLDDPDPSYRHQSTRQSPSTSATDDGRARAAAESAAKATANSAVHGRARPRRRRKRRADRGNRMDVADDDGATIELPPTTTVRSKRRWWRAHCDDQSLHAPPPTESSFGRSRDRAAIFGGGRVPKSLCCAALPVNPTAGPISAGAAARGQSHARNKM